MLNLLAPILSARLPARAPIVPHMINVMGNINSVEMVRRPIWEGNTRVVVDQSGLITVDVIDADGNFSEIWRSDAPFVVQAPRPREEAASGIADKQQPA